MSGRKKEGESYQRLTRGKNEQVAVRRTVKTKAKKEEHQHQSRIKITIGRGSHLSGRRRHIFAAGDSSGHQTKSTSTGQSLKRRERPGERERATCSEEDLGELGAHTRDELALAGRCFCVRVVQLVMRQLFFGFHLRRRLPSNQFRERARATA